MDSGRLYFDPSSSHGGNMLFLGNGSSGFRGQTLMMSMGDSPKKRPFFTTSSEELYDDEYYDEQLPEKKRRLTPDQVVMLEKSFEEENKLEPERKTQLAKKLGLQPRQVAVWFQNRRARWKTKNLERDYDLLKSAYDSLLANYETATMENDKLKSEVLLLTETLQARDVNGSLKPGPSQGPIADPNIVDPLPVDPAQQLSTKAEDLLSSGSTVGSAVVNEDVNPQLVDSGDSYFPGYPPLAGPIDAVVQSEEDDGSEDGGSGYLCNMFGAVGSDDPNQDVGLF
ncbi:hypothetical protein V2J09_013623 [Rumex salicifolius]